MDIARHMWPRERIQTVQIFQDILLNCILQIHLVTYLLHSTLASTLSHSLASLMTLSFPFSHSSNCVMAPPGEISVLNSLCSSCQYCLLFLRPPFPAAHSISRIDQTVGVVSGVSRPVVTVVKKSGAAVDCRTR